MKRVAVTGVLMLVVASCSEHFPRRLTEEDLPFPIFDPGDSSVVTPVDDASTADGTASDADAGADADADTDAVADAMTDASTPPIAEGGNCNVRLETPVIVDSPHVQQGTAVAYTTNPPASGPHYPVWANFQEFTTVVPDGNLVHSLEHGAVLLLYNCEPADAACAKIIADLRAVRAAIATDPKCDASIRVRVIIARRPLNDTVVAAAAWGQTYRSDCVDIASLTSWVTTNYAQAPENFCFAGQTSF
jgi:hypothetical protein